MALESDKKVFFMTADAAAFDSARPPLSRETAEEELILTLESIRDGYFACDAPTYPTSETDQDRIL